MAVGRGELEELLEALNVLRQENAALRRNFDELVDVHERAQRKAAAAAAEAEHAAHARAVEHAAAITRLHEELVAANVNANRRLADAQHADQAAGEGAPGSQQQQGVRELGLALGAAHAACAALLEENGSLRRENEQLRGAVADGEAHAALQRVMRDAEVQHTDSQFEAAAAQLVAQLRNDVAEWRAAAEAATAARSPAGGDVRREAVERRLPPPGDGRRGASTAAAAGALGPPAFPMLRPPTELTAVPEADELTALARFYSRR